MVFGYQVYNWGDPDVWTAGGGFGYVGPAVDFADPQDLGGPERP
jgi:hypothetical protein